MNKRVAIIGAAHRFPGANSAETFWQALREERDLVTSVAPDRWGQEAFYHPDKQQPGTSYSFAAGSLGDIAGFDAGFFGISPREAAQMDPQQRLLLEMTWEAMEDAGVPPQTLRGGQCGVYVGVASLDYSYRMADDMAAIDAPTATGNTSSIVSNRISYLFDLHGPSLSLDTACSSSLVAFHQACQAIRCGETDTALAGGISLHLHPYGFIIFSKANMLSPSGRCRVFDADGDGYVRSEGGGMFLLKDYDKAVADGDRILALVAATGVNTDGDKAGLSVPNADAQIALMTTTLARAGLDADDLDYLEAHGTGTAVGDPIEARAIGMAIGQKRSRPLPIGSVKSNLGHLETASGVAGLAKALYVLRFREVPATIGIRTLNPRIDFKGWNLDVVTRAQPLKPEGDLTIGINSFGFGGANAHVILQSPPQPPEIDQQDSRNSDDESAPLPIRLSARSEDALGQSARKLSEHLQQRDIPLGDLAYSLYQRREQHQYGALLFARNTAQIVEQLARFAAGDDASEVVTGQRIADAQGPVFVYSGNGCQWATMGKALLESSPVFAAAIDEVDALFQQHADFSLRAELEGRNGEGCEGEDRLADTEIAQPTLFALQVGLTRLLHAEGIAPTQVTGHSVGEVAAAWACGSLTLAEAVRVIFLRSAYQGQTRGQGQMTAVGLGADAIQPWLDDPRFQKVSLAGINSPRGVTLAGPTEALERLEASLAEQRIVAKRLPLEYAFHSPAMDGIRDGVVDELAALTPQAGTIPFISTVSGGPLEGSALGADYWWRNIREPVRFEAAIDSLIEEGANVFVEIGAHPILRRYLSNMLAAHQRPGAVITTLSRKTDAAEAMTVCIAQTLLSGAPLPAARYFPSHFSTPGAFVDLPHYPWQRERHWVRPTSESQGLMARHYEHPLLGYRLAQQELTWESQLDAKRLPWLGDHVVGDAIVFPGAGYAELALAAAQSWKAMPLIDLEALEIHSPMLLDAPHGKRMRLDIQEADGRLRIRSREPASDERWSLNASARLLTQSRGLSLERTAPALPTRAPDFDREQHLALARHIGLEYGPAFQAISHGWLEDENSVIGAIDLPTAIRETQKECLLHPGILDSAFQLFIPLLAEELRQDSGLAFVPVRLERLQMRRDCGEPALIRVRLTSRAPHSLCADVELFAANGQAIAVIEGARFKAVRLKQPSRQRLSYLDHRLVPVPRHTTSLPLDSGQLAQAFEALTASYRQATGSRYAGEVEPLLDAMLLAFLREGLAAQADANGHIPAAFLEMGSSDTRRLRGALLSLAQGNGLIDSQASGWQLREEEDVPAAAIWNLLIRDYPGYAALTHQLGRLGRHLPTRLAEDEDIDVIDSQLGARLFQQAIGESGWHSLANGLGEQIEALLGMLPNGHRLNLLEASAAQPRFGAPLLARLGVDRSRYRFLAVTQHARAAAESLREQHPDMTLLGLDDAAADGFGAQLALVTLDGSLADTRTLLERLPEHLAPDAHIILLGLASANWQHLLGALQDDHRAAPCSGSDALQLLESLGFNTPTLLPLEESDNGACLLHAQPPASMVSTETLVEHSHWLVISDAPERALGEALTAGLEARNQTVVHHQAANASAHELLAMFQASQIIDLRGLGGYKSGHDSPSRRCGLAMQWLQNLESRDAPVRLWLFTQGVSATLGGGFSDQTSPNVAEDAALWGFARSLHNEIGQHSVRLLDLPASNEFSGDVLDALLNELCQADAETEVVLDDKGQRWAPRLGLQDAPELRHIDARENQALSLGFELPGQLRHLRWQAHTLGELGEHQVEVRVKATGLNFRDVMYALGLLSDEAIEQGFAGATLGLEFAGEVVRVGSKVERFSAGDAVVGFGPASFSDRLIADTHTLAPLPEGIDYAAAAAIPTTFFTVYYALKYLARIAPGERLLIHGAAGGVGLAAIQIGRWLGAEIYATVGSDEKRDFLQLLGVERLFDSRSLTFAEEILHDDPNGQGVDVVLNSLAGEAINQNLRVLKPFGRFIELGKRDFYENTQVGLRPFRNNLSYFGVDSDQLMRELPALTQTLFSEMMALFADGTLAPLPYTVFDSHRVVEAFRYMQQARQIGKVVVTYDTAPPAAIAAANPGRLTLDAEASYLVTGGLGGFGLATAGWLADKGARHLILIGRSGAQRDEVQQGIARLETRGVQVHAAACDVTQRADLAALLDACRASLPPLKGVVHAATVIDDGLIRNLDEERIARALAPKIDGARHLDALTRNDALDFFVLYSSATTLFGNPGQASYVAANHWLEALVSARRAQGRPATCVRWGAIEDVGFLARHTQTRDALQERLGGQALNSTDALAVLEQMLLNDTPTLGVLELDWHALARFLPTADAPRYAEIARSAGEQQASKDDVDFRQLLGDLDTDELHAALLTLLRKELAKILLTEEDKIDPQRSIYDLGFDSLMGVELVTALEARLGLQIPVMVLSEASTLARFADYLMRKLQGQDADNAAGADDADSDKAIHRASLITLHGVDEPQTTPQYAESDA